MDLEAQEPHFKDAQDEVQTQHSYWYEKEAFLALVLKGLCVEVKDVYKAQNLLTLVVSTIA